MAKEAREIIAFSESQIGPKDKLREFKLGALHMARVAVDYAEKIGALPTSLPQFSRVTELTQGRTESTETPLTDKERLMADLGLTPEQVAGHPSEVNGNTRAYVGSLVHRDGEGRIVPVLNKLAGVEHIYISPERKIRTVTLRVDGRIGSKDQAAKELRQSGRETTDWAQDMLGKTPFTKKARTVRLAFLSGYDTGFNAVATTTERFGRIQALGLEKCDPELAIYQGIEDRDQEMDTYYSMVMDTIADRGGRPYVFGLGSSPHGRFLHDHWARPDGRWRPLSVMVAVFPQVEPVKP